MRGFQVLSSQDVLIEDLSITDSNVTNNHVIYLFLILRIRMENTFISGVRVPE